MVTKLKNISCHKLTKVLAFIGVIASLTMAIVYIQYIDLDNVNPETVFVKEYEKSQAFRDESFGGYFILESILEYETRDETQVNEKKPISTEEDVFEDDLFNSDNEEVSEELLREDNYEYAKNELKKGKYQYYIRTRDDIIYINNSSGEMSKILDEPKGTIQELDKHYKSLFEDLKWGYYYLENNNPVYKNYGGDIDNSHRSYLIDMKSNVLGDQKEVYFALSEEYVAIRQKERDEQRMELIPLLMTVAISSMVGLLLIIYLIIVTGRKAEDKEIHLNIVDRLYSDISVLLLITMGFAWLVLFAESFNYQYNYYNSYRIYDQNYVILFMSVLTIIPFTGCGMLILSLVRQIKAKILIKHSFTYKLALIVIKFIKKVWSAFKSIFDGRIFKDYPLTKSLFFRQIIFVGSSMIICFFALISIMVEAALLFFIFVAAEILMVYWYFTYNNQTYKEINKGFNESLEEQMRAERMKIDLITNVSHDLKTPLTSIISYVDLLSKEEFKGEAGDYISILQDKSNRLKNIVSDLFDLAKSTSGDIHLELEQLDLKRLIEQTMADMEDDIEKSGAYIKERLPVDPLYIYSDGKKLYRAVQNILDNAIKYSLDGTRIYIELIEEEGYGIATIKNISAYEMDFTEEEILQRFNRGDSSRATDGSGLGLSIAESFTRVSGGEFEVKIDGDMFKVMFRFKLVKQV